MSARHFGFVDIGLAMFGFAALMAMTPIGKGIAIYAAMSVIGLPITLLFAALPTLFIIFALTRLYVFVLGRFDWLTWISGVGFAFAILLIIPMALNRDLDGKIEALLAGDHAATDHHAVPAMLAMLDDQQDPSARCSSTCRDLLVSGRVQQIAVGAVRAGWMTGMPAQNPFKVYGPFAGSDCDPALKAFAGFKRTGLNTLPSSFDCLGPTSLTLVDVDTVVAQTTLPASGELPGCQFHRLTYAFRKDGHWVENARRTFGHCKRYSTLFIYTYTGGMELFMAVARETDFINWATRDGRDDNVADFLRKDLGWTFF